MKRFIRFIGMAVFFFSLASCNSLKVYRCKPIYVMDTTVEITFYNVSDVQKHYEEIKKIYQKYDRLCSDFTSGGESPNIYDLNEKRNMIADSDLIELIQKAVFFKEDTEGYYNPFIGRLSHAWKNAIQDLTVVADETVQKELDIMMHTDIIIEKNQITLIGEGNVDLGGIAKGYATEKAKEYLDSVNISSYLINAGNSNVLLGDKNSKSFVVALEEPYRSKNILLIEAKNIAIGTSSGKYQSVLVDNIRYHHLLNPFTGYPAIFYDNVNVSCTDSVRCDVYSTAVFCMDVEKAKSFCKERDVELLLFKDMEILYKSDGWREYA